MTQLPEAMDWETMLLYGAAITVAVSLLLKALRLATKSDDLPKRGSRHSRDYIPLQTQETDAEEGGNDGEKKPKGEKGFWFATVISMVFGIITVAWFALMGHNHPTWQQMAKSAPAIIYGLYLALIAQWDSNSWPKSLIAFPLYLWMLLASQQEMRICALVLQSIGGLLATIGLHGDYKKGIVMLNVGLCAMWFTSLSVFGAWTWQAAVFVLPGVGWGAYSGVSSVMDENFPGLKDPRFVLVFVALLLYTFPLPGLAVGPWWLLWVSELPVFAALMVVIWLDIRRPYLTHIVISIVIIVIAVLLPVAASMTSGHFMAQIQAMPIWAVNAVPMALGLIYIMVELFGRMVWKAFFNRTELISRGLALLVLLALPLALQMDTAALQAKAIVVDLYPSDYIAANLTAGKSNHGFDVNLNVTSTETSVQRLRMPRPRWPDLDALGSSSDHRAGFWLSWMVLKVLVATAVAVLVFCCKVPCAGRNQQEGRINDRDRKGLTILLVFCQLALCTKLCLTLSHAGQLTGSGMVWEGFDQVLTWALLWFITQTISLRMMSFEASYDPIDVILSVLFLVPYMGDAFDTLKDAMLASIAMRTDIRVLQVLGVISMAYLWLLHFVYLLPRAETMIELQRAYLPVYFLKPKRGGQKHSTRVKVCSILYKQTTPARQKAMLAEDVPQGLLAFVIALVGHAGTFTTVMNIIIPVARMAFAWWFHGDIAETVKDWLVQEALESFENGRSAEADDHISTVWRLQARLPDWKPSWNDWLDEERQSAMRDKVVKEEAEEEENGWPYKLISSSIFRPHFLVQLARSRPELEIPAALVQRAFQTLFLTANSDAALQPLFIQWATEIWPRDGRFSANFEKTALGSTNLLQEILLQLKDLKELELNLAETKLGDTGVKQLAAAVAEMKGLKELEVVLAKNNISDEGVKCLASSMAQMKEMKELVLNLGKNNISDEGVKCLASSMAQNSPI